MQQAPMPGGPGEAVAAVADFLRERSQTLHALGVARERIVIDPGIGFGKTPEQNLALLARQRELLAATGAPLLAGWSRKSTLGLLLADEGQPPPAPGERISASVAAALIAVQRGAALVRVHDVAATAQALKVWAAVQALSGSQS